MKKPREECHRSKSSGQAVTEPRPEAVSVFDSKHRCLITMTALARREASVTLVLEEETQQVK